MALLGAVSGSVYVDLIGSTDDTRNLRGANVWWVDSSTGSSVEVDSITLTVKDVEGTSQYLLTTLTTPAIELAQPGLVYSVDEIDVSNFPDGYITLNWEGTLDGYSYTEVETVSYNTAPDMVFVSGSTATLGDFKCILDQAKTFSTRVVDSIGNPVSTYGVRARFYDRTNGVVVETKNATLTSAGSGIWTVSNALATGSYSADLDRYEVYWQWQQTDGGTFLEIENSRAPLQVYGVPASVTTGGLTYSTNNTIRQTFPNIDSLLSDMNENQAEREMILNRVRLEASIIISDSMRGTTRKYSRDVLELLEIYEAYRLILIKMHSFAKTGLNDEQIRAVENHIKRLKATVKSPMATMRIGPRA